MTPEQFKQKRKDLGLSQNQLSKELGLSEKTGDAYIRKIENGSREPSGLLLRCFILYELCKKNNLLD